MFYIQKQGTAMGTKMAPAYTNIFMGTLESSGFPVFDDLKCSVVVCGDEVERIHLPKHMNT